MHLTLHTEVFQSLTMRRTLRRALELCALGDGASLVRLKRLNYVGHDHIGLDYTGHNSIGHTYTGLN